MYIRPVVCKKENQKKKNDKVYLKKKKKAHKQTGGIELRQGSPHGTAPRRGAWQGQGGEKKKKQVKQLEEKGKEERRHN